MALHERRGSHLTGQMELRGHELGRWHGIAWMDEILGVPEEDMRAPLTFDDVRGASRL